DTAMRMQPSVMTRYFRHLARCLVLLTAFSAVAQPLPAAAQDSMRIAAVVNEDIISELDIYMRLRMAMISARLEDSPETRDRLMPEVLRNLIDDRLKLQEAKREGIRVNPADVDKRIDALAERNGMSRPDMEQYLRSQGVLIEALADQLNAELSWARL